MVERARGLERHVLIAPNDRAYLVPSFLRELDDVFAHLDYVVSVRVVVAQHAEVARRVRTQRQAAVAQGLDAEELVTASQPLDEVFGVEGGIETCAPVVQHRPRYAIRYVPDVGACWHRADTVCQLKILKHAVTQDGVGRPSSTVRGAARIQASKSPVPLGVHVPDEALSAICCEHTHMTVC